MSVIMDLVSIKLLKNSQGSFLLRTSNSVQIFIFLFVENIHTHETLR